VRDDVHVVAEGTACVRVVRASCASVTTTTTTTTTDDDDDDDNDNHDDDDDVPNRSPAEAATVSKHKGR
jgi:hypothetical protein